MQIAHHRCLCRFCLKSNEIKVNGCVRREMRVELLRGFWDLWRKYINVEYMSSCVDSWDFGANFLYGF